MSDAGPELRLGRVVIGVSSLAEAAGIFAEKLELPGASQGDAHRIPIGASQLELRPVEEGRGLARLVLVCDDPDAVARRLASAGVPFERRDDGSLVLDGAATHGAPLDIVRA